MLQMVLLACETNVKQSITLSSSAAGDAQISIGQRLTLSGALIVSTPQVLTKSSCSTLWLTFSHIIILRQLAL